MMCDHCLNLRVEPPSAPLLTSTHTNAPSNSTHLIESPSTHHYLTMTVWKTTHSGENQPVGHDNKGVTWVLSVTNKNSGSSEMWYYHCCRGARRSADLTRLLSHTSADCRDNYSAHIQQRGGCCGPSSAALHHEPGHDTLTALRLLRWPTLQVLHRAAYFTVFPHPSCASVAVH